MPDKETHQAQQLVDQARDLERHERARFLETACAGDDELLQSVQILLSDSSGDITQAISRDPDVSKSEVRPEPASEKKGPGSGDETRPEPEYIGPYRVIGLIGSGGMGQVYRAEQSEPVRRDVAVKVLRTTIFDRDQELRFLAERQAMAHLTHPNIAQLYDAGDLTDGFPYFAMEYVQGLPLTIYADQNRLTIPERLKIFLDVCEGVSFAHLKGILHRDLKPENILVADYGDQPQPKIIDFGIAKAIDTPLTDEDLHTGVVALGTLPYMGPEALEHVDGIIDLDYRSDVYALGVVLYELLTGRRPYEQSGRPIISFVAAITAGNAQPPSASLRSTRSTDLDRLANRRQLDVAALHRRLKGDLDWIVMKAIEADREQRYASVLELIADIQRYLNYEPVKARPPSTLYRIRKFTRRHRVATLGGMLAVVALLVGVGTTVFGMLRAQEARALAVEQAKIAWRGQMAAEQATDFVLDLFLDADPYRAHSETHGEELTARQLLDQSGERLLESGLKGQPQMRIRLMAALAEVYLRIGLTDKAEQLLVRAEQIGLQIELPENQVRVDLLIGLANLATVKADYTASENHYRDAYRIARRTLGEDHQNVARIRADLGKVILTAGDAERAEYILEAAMESARRTVGVEHEDFVNSINALAFAHYAQGEYEQAEHYFRETLEYSFPDRSIDDPNVAKSQNNLALALVSQGKVIEAESLIALAIDNFSHSLPEGHWRSANAQTVLAACHMANGNLETAERLLLRNYPLVVAARGVASPYAQRIREWLIELYEKMGKPDQAEIFRNQSGLTQR